ncbi:MAG: hypothetical protein UZ21_OP11001000450 [Microgenomates bacterium OLB22]|nr:MAG: hypothetical protein UZ21_OP11001000450 [Microgenomates bacterium OLB22]
MMCLMEPYKQTTSQSCLPVCLLQCHGIVPSTEKEKEIPFEGLLDLHGGYVAGIVTAFQRQYSRRITIYVDNAYFCSFLKTHYDSKNLVFIHQKVRVQFLEQLSYPVIVQIDTHQLGNYDHSPHYIIIESATPATFTILEPAVGKRIRMSKKKLEESIKSLRIRLRYCPLVIKVGNKKTSPNKEN